MRFADRNPEYLLCSIIYCATTAYLFGWLFWQIRVFIIVSYIIMLLIAFSPLAEKFMRMFYNVRRLETLEEQDLLLTIFNEVIEKAKENDIEVFGDTDFNSIELFIVDSMTVNAFALGKRTVAITKGAMATFSEDELKAVFSHEIAHILYADTMAQIYTKVGSGFFRLLFCK
jgi:heat shock protein HtpX